MIFGPKVLETIASPINGQLEVRQLGKDVYVTTSGLTQSGGLINELWTKTLKRVSKSYELRARSWLILGLATGTLAKLVSDKYSPTKIVGVELDPAMIRLGKKYFGLDKIPYLDIVVADAQSYVLKTKNKFGVVIVDLYIGDQLPTFVYQKKFLKQLQKLGLLVILNHLFYDADKRAQARLLSDRAATVFAQVRLVRELTNLLVICG